MNAFELMRRDALKWGIALGLVWVLASGGMQAAEHAGAERPNILFCLADDWGWPHAGAYGDRIVKTPAFDRLAQEGVLFEYAYVSSPSCTPCRNSILTGQQFYRLGPGASLRGALDTKHPNFMMVLRDAGYEIGHWRKAWGPGNYKDGGYTEHPCGPATTFDGFLAKRDKAKPFCFWFGTSDPHRGYKKGSGKAAGISLAKIDVPAFLPDTREVRGDIADYYFEVQRWDKDVNEALKLLEAEGELDNTIIVMSGDHGMPFPRCKGNLYDSGARVPLAIRWGDTIKTAGRTVSDFTSLTDLAPTFLDAAGIMVPDAMTGKSLLPALQSNRDGRVDKDRDYMVFGRERHTPAQKMPSLQGYPSRAIRTDKWLLIVNAEPGRWPAGVPEGASHPIGRFADCDNGPTKSVVMGQGAESEFYALCFARRGAVELYDCEKDPFQVNNLAANPEQAATVKRLRAQLVKTLANTGDPRFTDARVQFDDYPYSASYMKKRSKAYGKKK